MLLHHVNTNKVYSHLRLGFRSGRWLYLKLGPSVAIEHLEAPVAVLPALADLRLPWCSRSFFFCSAAARGQDRALAFAVKRSATLAPRTGRTARAGRATPPLPLTSSANSPPIGAAGRGRPAPARRPRASASMSGAKVLKRVGLFADGDAASRAPGFGRPLHCERHADRRIVPRRGSRSRASRVAPYRRSAASDSAWSESGRSSAAAMSAKRTCYPAAGTRTRALPLSPLGVSMSSSSPPPFPSG